MYKFDKLKAEDARVQVSKSVNHSVCIYNLIDMKSEAPSFLRFFVRKTLQLSTKSESFRNEDVSGTFIRT